MSRLFGTAGIRGITNQDITPELVVRLTKALTTLAPVNAKIGVAHDTRFGSHELANIAALCISLAGKNAFYFGVLASGPFSFNIKRLRLNFGVMITGSHMPPERNGIIIIENDGSYAPFSLTDRLEALISRDNIPLPHPFKIKSLSIKDGVSIYKKEMLLKFRVIKPMKILIDPANGAACELAADIFRELGCKVVEINSDRLPIPARHSEPRAENVKTAARLVRKLNCDIGVCLDVDADRVMFITNDGISVSEDTTGALFALYELRKNDICVVPVNSSAVIEYAVKKKGAILKYCGIGQPETIKAIKKLGGVYSYEESGKYYFCKENLYSDGIFSALKLAEIMSKTRKDLKTLSSEIPRYYPLKFNVHIKSQKKAWDKIRTKFDKQDRNVKHLDIKIDGFKRIYEDGSWLMIRPSGTEPLIRVYSDSSEKKRSQKLLEFGKKIVTSALLFFLVLIYACSTVDHGPVLEKYEEAKQLISKKEFKGAISKLNELLALDPSMPQAWQARATCHEKLGDKTKAKEDLDMAVNKAQEDEKYIYYFARARFHHKNKENDLALADYTTAAKSSLDLLKDGISNNYILEIFRHRGLLYEETGKIKEAIIDYEIAMNIAVSESTKQQLQTLIFTLKQKKH